MKAKKKVNWGGLVVALALPGLCLLFVIPAMLSSNPLFATGVIRQRPDEVVLYYEGQEHHYWQEDDEYKALVDSAYEVIADQAGIVEWGWSAERFEQARSTGIAVEMFYSDPVKVPGSRVDIGDTYRLFIPLEVFGFSGGDIVFRGGTDAYWGAPIRLTSLEPVRAVVDDIVGADETSENLGN